MSLTIRRVTTDEDYAAVQRLEQAVFPHDLASTVEQMRAGDAEGRLRLLAVCGDEAVGTGTAARSGLAGGAYIAPVVLPARRRRGIGTALLRPLLEHAQALQPDFLVAHTEDEAGQAFAERWGFAEVDRQIEQVRAIAIGREPPPEPVKGVEVMAVAERPELWRAAYERVALEAFRDMALIAPVEATPEAWQRDWLTDPAATFLALAGGEVIGLAGLHPDPDRPDRAENALTAVRREWRRRGIASLLKRTALAHAAAHGIAEVHTWTQHRNVALRQLNERLGYVVRRVSLTMRAQPPVRV